MNISNLQSNGNGKGVEKKLEFPVHFELKVVLETTQSVEVQQAHIAHLLAKLKIENSFVASKPSSKGNFVSYTYKVLISGQMQMDSMYSDLKTLPGIKFAL
jgi:putative lipoic acid-binding regulatory protein